MFGNILGLHHDLGEAGVAKRVALVALACGMSLAGFDRGPW